MSTKNQISNDEFFARLSALFSASSSSKDPSSASLPDSVFMTQKRLSHSESPPTSEASSGESLEPAPLLIRIQSKRSKARREKGVHGIKFSTVVAPGDLETFFVRFAETGRAGMSGLKKRERKKKGAKKKKKGVAAAAAPA